MGRRSWLVSCLPHVTLINPHWTELMPTAWLGPKNQANEPTFITIGPPASILSGDFTKTRSPGSREPTTGSQVQVLRSRRLEAGPTQNQALLGPAAQLIPKAGQTSAGTAKATRGRPDFLHQLHWTQDPALSEASDRRTPPSASSLWGLCLPPALHLPQAVWPVTPRGQQPSRSTCPPWLVASV